MVPSPPNSPESPERLHLELQGRFEDKVQIAKTFQSVYEVLDRLCHRGVKCFEVVYHADFEVQETLAEEFMHAAREALAYKDALSFGRDIETRVVGLEQIEHPQTREMVSTLHARS
jgi:hypothetical protein